MIRTILFALAGLAAGAVMAGAVGGALGAVVGAAVGLMWASVRTYVTKPSEGTVPRTEHQRVVCIPNGQAADCVLLRDERTGRWLDVVTCSLTQPASTEIHCDKRCLQLMNDTA